MSESRDRRIETVCAAIRNQAISPQQVADQIVEASKPYLQGASTTHVACDGDTPGLESFFWSIWCEVFKLAQEDRSTHDRIAHVLAALKDKHDDGCEDWRLWGSESNWSKLPAFGLVSREMLNGAFDTVATGLVILSLITIGSSRRPEPLY